MFTFRARYVKDKITQRREQTIVWCLHLCIFSQGIGYRSGLSLDEYVQTCSDASILMNGPLKSFKH